MFLSQIGRMVEHPEASTEILNNHDILAATICCIGEEKMDVAKQVRTQAKKYVAWVFNDARVGAIIVLFSRPFSRCPN